MAIQSTTSAELLLRNRIGITLNKKDNKDSDLKTTLTCKSNNIGCLNQEEYPTDIALVTKVVYQILIPESLRTSNPSIFCGHLKGENLRLVKINELPIDEKGILQFKIPPNLLPRASTKKDRALLDGKRVIICLRTSDTKYYMLDSLSVLTTSKLHTEENKQVFLLLLEQSRDKKCSSEKHWDKIEKAVFNESVPISIQHTEDIRKRDREQKRRSKQEKNLTQAAQDVKDGLPQALIHLEAATSALKQIQKVIQSVKPQDLAQVLKPLMQAEQAFSNSLDAPISLKEAKSNVDFDSDTDSDAAENENVSPNNEQPEPTLTEGPSPKRQKLSSGKNGVPLTDEEIEG